MKIKKTMPVVLLLGGFVLIKQAKAQDDWINQLQEVGYSAEMVVSVSTKSQAEQIVNKAKIYFTKDKIRFESPLPGAFTLGNVVQIYRMDKGVIWVITGDQQTYLEMPYSRKKSLSDDGSSSLAGVEEGQGTLGGFDYLGEQLQGYNAKNCKVKEESFPGEGRFRVVVSCENIQFVSEVRNIVIGKPDDELFEVPAGYRKISLVQNAEGGMKFQGENK